jgi:hypothetical protein
MSWTDILAGGVINPSYTVLVSYTPTANLTLEWPNVATADNQLGDIVELYVYQAGLTITLPDATKGSAGGASLFVNKGSQLITLKNATSTAVGTVGPGQQVFVYLSSTGTQAGVWTVFVFAAGSSLAQSAALSSASVAARGNTLVQAAPILSLNSDYIAGIADQGQVLNWVGGAGTFTLSDAATLGAGWFCHIRNSGTGALTLNPTSGTLNTIDAAGTLLFNPGESAICVCDGLKFVTISKTVTQINNFSYTSLDVSGTGTYTITTAQTGYSVYRLTGVLTGARQIVFPTTLTQFTVRNETTGAFTLTVKTAANAGTVVGTNEAKIVYCDGSDIKPSSTAGIAFPIAVSQGGTGATSAASALANLGVSTLGIGLIQAASAVAARSFLAFGSLGDLIAQQATALPLPDGTAAAPVYSFSSDPDTGMWRRGANDLGLAIGGNDRYSFQDGTQYIYSAGGFKTVYHTGNLPSVPTQLGYTPVQQGTGIGQLTNAVKIGWNGSVTKLTIDSTDMGAIWTTAGMASSLGSPGYIRFPNGLTLQWGPTGSLIAGSTTVSFPVAFTTSVFAFLSVAAAGGLPRFHTTGSISLTTGAIFGWSDTGAASTAAGYWFAIGI